MPAVALDYHLIFFISNSLLTASFYFLSTLTLTLHIYVSFCVCVIPASVPTYT